MIPLFQNGMKAASHVVHQQYLKSQAYPDLDANSRSARVTDERWRKKCNVSAFLWQNASIAIYYYLNKPFGNSPHIFTQPYSDKKPRCIYISLCKYHNTGDIKSQIVSLGTCQCLRWVTKGSIDHRVLVVSIHWWYIAILTFCQRMAVQVLNAALFK